ncbi:hypothetical protein ACFQ60_26680 [Streptomyces zhihengii]
MSASTRFGAHTLAYPEPGTAGSRRPGGWKPWDVTTDAPLHGCVATVGHLVCSGPEGVEARRTADGTLMWKHPLALRPGEPAMVPAVSGDERVYLPEGSDVLVAGLDDGRPVARWAGPAGFLPEMAVATQGSSTSATRAGAGSDSRRRCCSAPTGRATARCSGRSRWTPRTRRASRSPGVCSTCRARAPTAGSSTRRRGGWPPSPNCARTPSGPTATSTAPHPAAAPGSSPAAR